MSGPDSSFWQAKFDAGHTPWDRGTLSPQLRAWLESGLLNANQHRRIAIPGCGAGHEAVALAQRGFAVTALDYAPAAVARTRAALQAVDAMASVEQADVLVWQAPQPFDAIYEQTCLCALHPDHWVAYAAQLHRWLKPGGTLFALFAQALRPAASEGRVEGPPYHCDINAMRALFPAAQWQWPKPPYARLDHPMGMFELVVVLKKRATA